MTRKPKQKPLTELEGTALAIIMREGPCTPYYVKEAFRNSPSEFWSGSAGAVYPMMRRLAARGLISGRPDASDGRARQEYGLTAKGRAAVKAWLLDAGKAAGLGFDPLRSRLFFIELMTPRERDAFIADVAAQMAEGADPPDVDLPHVAPLHELWSRYRLDALKAFVRKLK